MKVPPKRKGNALLRSRCRRGAALNESPSEKEGKFVLGRLCGGQFYQPPSMKVPPKRKGNDDLPLGFVGEDVPSMKVPPKRKGNKNADSAKCALALNPQ